MTNADIVFALFCLLVLPSAYGQTGCSNCVDNMCNDRGICQAGCKTGFEGEKCDLTSIEAPPTLTEAPPTSTEVPPTSTEAPPASEENVEMYVGIGFLILALLASGLTCYILAARRKKKEEGGEGNVQTSQETEKPDAQESEIKGN